MKLTKQRLKEIIKEELMNESPEGRAQMHAKGLSKDALRVFTYLKKGDVDKARYFMKDIIDSLKEVEKYTRKNDAAYLSLKKGPLSAVKEGNIGISTKKGKSIELTHRTSGKEIVVVNTPNVLKKYAKMGYLISMPEGLNEDIGTNWVDSDVAKNPEDYSGKRSGNEMNMFYNSYSSSEAKKVVEGKLAEYVKQLRKLEGKLIKDWMSSAKSGVIDFFDLMRGFNVGNVQRAHKYEINFLSGLLERDKIQDRFRSYFKGKKGKPRGK